jgi:8-oxo-dGTP pyrophosphatase MutT (NUDIX family)
MNPHDSQIHFWMVLVVMDYEGTLTRVEGDRPAPGEELNTGAPTEPRAAATVIVLRGGGERLEVLLVRRNPAARFMGGAWVFPGGALDGAEDHRAAAVREVAEEAAVTLPDPAALVEFSRWITPAQVQIRFDTLYLLAPAPPDADPRPDGGETVDVAWHTPRTALDAGERGELDLVFPTIKTLEQLAPFGSADELLAWAEGRDVVPIEPRVVMEGEVARVVLPGEPGYEG